MSGIRLIAGLGNPGPRYEQTRHNVGVWYVEALARRFGITFQDDAKFKGLLGKGVIFGHEVRVLLPQTFMNDSGESVGAVQRFFKLAPEEILVAYDEVAFEPGVVRLKFDGGANGHNGIKSVISGLGNARDFARLRIGVGHSGDKNKMVAYLTSVKTPASEREKILSALEFPDDVLKYLLEGDAQKAMTLLHAPEEK